MKVKFFGAFLTVGLVLTQPLCAAEPLVVDRDGASITGTTAEYAGMTLHGDYTIGTGASVTNLSSSGGTRLDIGPNEGDDVTMTITGGGQFVGSGTTQKSLDAIVIGCNGGKGKIVVQDVADPSDKKRNKSGWYYNNYTFGAMSWNLMLAEGASNASDTMDIVQIDTNAFFSIWCVSNKNTQVKARILFNGGTYYMHQRMFNSMFNPVAGSEIILEGINGNDVNIMRMSGGIYQLVGYATGSNTNGWLRFRGSGNVVLNGTGDTTASSRPGFTITERCSFEQSGDLIVKGYMGLRMGNVNVLPYSSSPGNVVLQDEGTSLDIRGKTVTVNGLLGCGVVSNGSTSAQGKLIVTSETDKLCSTMISKDLTWDNSGFGIECIKRGAGLILADSMPSAPKLTIEAGGVQTTSAATLETMKGQTVEFMGGTSLGVSAGVYTAVNTIFPAGGVYKKGNYAVSKFVPVTIASGAAYRAQAGDSMLYSPTVAAGGIVEKAGGGTLKLYDSDTAFAGTIRAMDGGTVKLVGLGDTNDFWRLTIKKSSASSKYTGIIQLAGIDLYDKDGVIAYDKTKMKQADFGKAANTLEAGEITAPVAVGTDMTGTHKDLKYLFDQVRGTYITCSNVVATLDNEGSWITIAFRLNAGHAAVKAFKLVKGYAGAETSLQAWSLESSPDGINWQVRSERSEGSMIYYNSSDGGVIVYDPMAGLVDNVSLGLAPTAVLRADSGATIDLSAVAEGDAPCGGIEFDYAQGGGTITRFEPVANGTLTITNWPDGTSIGGFELPLIFVSVGDLSNLSTWKVVVNGVEKENRIVFSGGKLCVAQKGFVMIVR